MLQLSEVLALLNAEVTSDETIPEGDGLLNAPRQQGNVWLKYTLQGELGWLIGGGTLYPSEREASLPNNGVEIASGTRLDVVAAIAALNGRPNSMLAMEAISSAKATQGEALLDGAFPAPAAIGVKRRQGARRRRGVRSQIL